MKTYKDFRKLASENCESHADTNDAERLAELLQTVYEAGAGDFKNELIDYMAREMRATNGAIEANRALIEKSVLLLASK